MNGSYIAHGSTGSVTLGTFSAAHLGDTLCTSPLPRLLSHYKGLSVYLIDHPIVKEVFAFNPYVAGYREGCTISLGAIQTGDGHIIQRLVQGFELPVPALPKPEIYLSPEEQRWAMEQRAQWPPNRPVCILSCEAVSDSGNVDRVNWEYLAQLLSERYTVVQPVLFSGGFPSTIVYRGLSVRQYMALFSVADCFSGGTSSGSHLAAAFNLPSIIVIWDALKAKITFPIVGPVTASDLDWKSAYLYPDHWFITAEEVNSPLACRTIITQYLGQIADTTTRGRRTPLSNNRHNPCGFVPKAPIRLSGSNGSRMRRIPSLYEGNRTYTNPGATDA